MCRHLLALALAGAGVFACATPARPPSPAPAGDPGAGALEQCAILLLLVDRQTYEPFAVEQALIGDGATRRELAVALGRIPDSRAESALLGLLADEQAEVRREAAFGLGQHRGESAEQPLLRVVGEADREAGSLAVEALGKRGVPLARVEPALAGLAAAERRERLLPWLFRFREERTVELAREELAAETPRLRAAAAYALAREPRPEALPDLRRLLADPEARVRGWAARGLGEVGGAADLPALRALLADPAEGPVVQALRAGARLLGEGDAASRAAWATAIGALLDDARPGVRVTALEAAAGALPDADLAARLERRLAEGHPRERALALLSLAAGTGEPAGPLVAVAAGDGEPQLRRAAAQVAAAAGRADLLAHLRADGDPGVRAAAWQATLEAAPRDALALGRALEDADPVVRAGALDHTLEHPVLPLAALTRALQQAAGDHLDDARLAAVRAIAARAAAEPLERGAAIEALEEIVGHPDLLMRRAAADGLVALGRERPEIGAGAAGFPPAAYAQIVQRTRQPVRVAMTTERGEVVLSLDCPRAPLTCLNFLQLANQGFYDGLALHRVVPDFVVQGGDPRGDGAGGPGYAIRDEIGRLRYERGVVGMALAGPDTGGSQFFVTLSPQPHLDGGYTAFGTVESGMEVMDRLLQGDRIVSVREIGPVGRGARRR